MNPEPHDTAPLDSEAEKMREADSSRNGFLKLTPQQDSTAQIDLSGDSDSATSDTILPVLSQASLDGANQGSASEDLGLPARHNGDEGISDPGCTAAKSKPSSRRKIATGRMRGEAPPSEVTTESTIVYDEPVPDPDAKLEHWRIVERALRAKNLSFRTSRRGAERSDRAPRFSCLCGGLRKEAAESSAATYRGDPVCPVTWVASVRQQSGLHRLIVEMVGVHKPRTETAEDVQPLRQTRHSRRNFMDHYTTVMVKTQVASSLTAREVRAKAQEHCRSLKAAADAGRLPFDVSQRPGWVSQKDKNGSVAVPLVCTSCQDPKKCTWVGGACYNSQTMHFELRCTGDHDPAGQRKKGGTVTPTQRAKLDASVSSSAKGRLVSINKEPCDPPTEPQEQNRLKNLKRRRREQQCQSKDGEEDAAEMDDRAHFTVDDIREAITASGACWRADMPLKEAVQGALADESLDSDELLVLSFHTFPRTSGKQGCCVVVSTKQLLLVPPSLSNPNYLKVGTDATFKDLFGDWKLMPLGLLTKRLSVTTLERGIQGTSWCTHCTPVLYCVTNSDGAVSCEHLLRAFDQVPLARIGPLATAAASVHCLRRDAGSGPNAQSSTTASCTHIRQLHGDWAKGIEAARRKMCPNSIRQGDYRHMFKDVQANIPGKLHARGQERKRLLKMLLRSFQDSRSHCSTLAEFHLYWTFLFESLAAKGEDEVIAYLKNQYFFTLSEQDAKDQYGLTSATHAQNGILCAAWWGSFCRVQPGSASGTQPVEVSHLHGFRDALVDERGVQLKGLAPKRFFTRMAEVLRMQGGQLRKGPRLLPDHPGSRDPLSATSDRLENIGRSNARQLLSKAESFHRVKLGDGNEGHVMPQSLLKWQPHAATSAADADSDDEEKGSWIQVPSRELSLSAAKAKLVAQMAVEKSCTNLEALWRKAGILRSDNFSLPDWRALRVKFVVVLTGPEASKYWMSRTSALYLCSCTYFAVAGRCEHEQCVHHILGTGNIDLTVVGSKGGRPPKPGPSKRGWSSVQLHHEHARADAQDHEHREKRRRAVGYLPSPPQSLLPGQQRECVTDAAMRPASHSSEAGPADVPVSTHQEVCVDSVRGENHHHRGPSLFSTDFDLVTRVLAADGHVLPHDGKIYWNQGSNVPRLHACNMQKWTCATHPRYAQPPLL